MIEKIYADSEYKFVKAVMLYSKSVDSNYILYFDSEYSIPVYGDDLVNAFVNGCIIDGRYKPVEIVAGSNGGYVVTCIQANNSTSTAMKFQSIDYSSAD